MFSYGVGNTDHLRARVPGVVVRADLLQVSLAPGFKVEKEVIHFRAGQSGAWPRYESLNASAPHVQCAAQSRSWPVSGCRNIQSRSHAGSGRGARSDALRCIVTAARRMVLAGTLAPVATSAARGRRGGARVARSHVTGGPSAATRRGRSAARRARTWPRRMVRAVAPDVRAAPPPARPRGRGGRARRPCIRRRRRACTRSLATLGRPERFQDADHASERDVEEKHEHKSPRNVVHGSPFARAARAALPSSGVTYPRSRIGRSAPSNSATRARRASISSTSLAARAMHNRQR